MTVELEQRVFDADYKGFRWLPALVEGYYWVAYGSALTIYDPDSVRVTRAYERQDLVEVARRHGVYVLQGFRQDREGVSTWEI